MAQTTELSFLPLPKRETRFQFLLRMSLLVMLSRKEMVFTWREVGDGLVIGFSDNIDVDGLTKSPMGAPAFLVEWPIWNLSKVAVPEGLASIHVNVYESQFLIDLEKVDLGFAFRTSEEPTLPRDVWIQAFPFTNGGTFVEDGIEYGSAKGDLLELARRWWHSVSARL